MTTGISKQSTLDTGNTNSENLWLYADEASLYSIEENSREERAADEFSPAPKKHQDVSNRTNEYGVTPNASVDGEKKPDLEANGDVGVEICFDEDDEIHTKASDDQFLFYDTGRRRCRVMAAVCFLCTFMVAILLPVTLSQRNHSRSNKSISSISDGSPSSFETDRPTPSPGPDTAAPSEDATYILSENYVYNALKQCQGTGSLFDATTPQGLVFRTLVQEVYDNTIVDATGAIAFKRLHSTDYLREKFSLSILYISTNGDSWSRNDNWLSTSDPCVDWSGVVCANNRTETSCAVTGIELASNGLSGELPDEFCCLPCVESIKMSYNEIGGDVLKCLVQIPTLDKIDFSGNIFGRPINSSATVATARSNNAASSP